MSAPDPKRSGGKRSGRSGVRRSQHFLRSGELAGRLVDRSTISRRDLVLEIGPGRGALTRVLARRCAELVAVEADAGLCRAVREQLRGASNVRIVHGDALVAPLPPRDFKVFANVPFHLTAPIVRRLTGAGSRLVDAHLVVQSEAAERFAGSPFAPESLVSLQLKPWWQVEILERLPARAFAPPPRVAAALLWLARRTRPLVEAQEAGLYRNFVAAAFGRRGESVREGTQDLFTSRQLRILARDLRFDPAARPSELDFDRWLGLFRAFACRVPDAGQRVRGAVRRLPRQPGERA